MVSIQNPSQTRITLNARELPRGPRGERRFYGQLMGRDWSVELRLSMGQRLESYPLMLGAVRTLKLIGSLTPEQYNRIASTIAAIARGDTIVSGNAWDTYNRIVEHAGTQSVMAAISAIPGVGTYASTAYIAARAVGAIGKDLTTAKKKKKPSGLTARAVAQATNKALAQTGRETRIQPSDIERAVRAYFAMHSEQGKKKLLELQKKPVVPSSEEYLELLALQFAREDVPSVEIASESWDAVANTAGNLIEAPALPCRCHVWSDTAGPMNDFELSGPMDDFASLAGAADLSLGELPIDRIEDLSRVPDLPGVAGWDDDLSMIAGPGDELPSPPADVDLASIAGPLGDVGAGDELPSPPADMDLASIAGPLGDVGAGDELPSPPADVDLASIAGPLGDVGAGDELPSPPADVDLASIAGPLGDVGAGDELPSPPADVDLAAIAGPPGDADMPDSLPEAPEDEPLGVGGPLGDVGADEGGFVPAHAGSMFFDPWTYAN